ncbi:MAG: ABC transporter substrate-binding protein, partial [Actinobacteria bacterium]|nr:ABC transporter substrate-binding protein [Actinomycetota bacterium]
MHRSPAFRVVIALVVVTMILAACSSGSDSTSSPGADPGATGVEGGTLRIGSLGPDSINPFQGTSLDSYTMFRYAYPYLTEYNEALDGYVGDLAESWDVSEDGKTWTFQLRSGAQWSDGEP